MLLLLSAGAPATGPILAAIAAGAHTAQIAAVRLVAPLALDGEAAVEHGPSGEAIAIVSLISIVGGYLLLLALWRYVFSDRAKARRREPPDRTEADGGRGGEGDRGVVRGGED